MMERQLAHLVRLVDDLLEVSRITHGKIDLRKEQVSLATVIESAVETIHPLLTTTGQRLTVELPPSALWLEGDPTRLSQIFGNLLNNAIKYTEPGQEIRIIARQQPDGKVEVSVQDNGAGIPAEDLPHVFDMFAQGEASQTQARGGLGIGLTLARTLVELHGGRIDAFSAGPGQGSQIQVSLPVARGETTTGVAEPRRMSEAAAPASTGRRILVVDDNRDAAASLARLLKLKGAEARTAFDGRSALTVLETEPVDVVILDIGMPDLDGHEVARRIRARPEWDGIRLIAMTGLGEAAVRQRSLEAGFDQHLVKPVAVDVLDGVLASAPGEKGRTRTLPQDVGPHERPSPAAPDIKPLPKGHGLAGSLAASLLHDLAQPLSSARCFAATARTLVTESSPGNAELRYTLQGIEVQAELACKIVELLRGVIAESEAETASSSLLLPDEARH
jgi:signal transduction histidine kinase